METTSSLNARVMNPNLCRTKEFLHDPINETEKVRYVPDPTFHSRSRQKMSRTMSTPERKSNTTTENKAPCKNCDIKHVSQSVIQEQPKLNYFGYLGPRNDYHRQRALTTTDIINLKDMPVIVTPTSVVLPDVTSDNSEHNTNDYVIIHDSSDNIIINSGFEKAIECCSCMCCAKAVMYHCTKDSDGEGTMADHPCTCRGPRSDCLGRWGIMGILTMFMPCLLCYIPLEACNHCYMYIKRCSSTKPGPK